MEGTEVRKLAELEDDHWWYRERRHLLAKAISGLTPGRAIDIGAAGGGNTRVLRQHGWDAVALEYGADGAEVAHGRGLATIRGDATRLPLADASLDLVVAFDLPEHLVDDDAAVAEVHRVLKPTGTYLVAVPADRGLWSDHDEAVDHVRRYTREGLVDLLDRGGFEVTDVRSWNVLLRPVVAMRRKTSSGSDLDDMHPLVNWGLRTIITAERYLPVGGLPGVSLLLRAQPRS
jgi:SAM-dependent methyltransferase